MSIISRDIINKDIQFTVYGRREKERVFSYSTLSDAIDIAKTYLIKEYNVKSGDKVLLCPNEFYIVWFFACSELGLTLIVSMSHNPTIYKSVTDKYGNIDHVIMNLNSTSYVIVETKYQEILIDAQVLSIYTDNEHKDEVWATPDTILTWSISETNVKRYNYTHHLHTHEFYHRLLFRNIKILNLVKEDRCTHSKILHHGSSLGTFFLPTINRCDHHFWITTRDNWYDTLVEDKITKCLFMYYDTLEFRYKNHSQIKDLSSLTIYVLRTPTPREAEYYVKKCNATMVSIFGTTATSGPIFLQEINNSNCDAFDSSLFGAPLDNFYDLSLDHHCLTVKLYNGTTFNTGDVFKIVNDQYFLTV